MSLVCIEALHHTEDPTSHFTSSLLSVIFYLCPFAIKQVPKGRNRKTKRPRTKDYR